MNYCISRTYLKDGNVNFFPIIVFSAESNEQAIEEFLRNRFFKAGTYRLFALKSFFPKDHIVPINPLNHFEIEDAIYTRVYKWDDNGDFISSSFEGNVQKEDKE